MNLRRDLHLAWCDFVSAHTAVAKYHYSQVMPAGKSVKIGVWEECKFIGAIIFGWGANNNIGKPFGLKMTEICELTRVALKKHKTPVTKIVSIAIGMLRKQSPGIKMIVSYADPRQGHHGGIYQAGNWIYVGIPKQSKGAHYIINGKIIHGRSVRSKWGSEKNIPYKWEYATGTEKHKYLMPLTVELKKKIELLRKPFPKRAISETNDTPSTHEGNGGVTPTIALQS